MRILGFEVLIRRVRAPVERTPRERLFEAIDELNASWQSLPSSDRVRPWILWEEKRVVASEWIGEPRIVHESPIE